MTIRFALAAALMMSATLDAQWLNYPTRGVPRTPDGKPNLNAQAPRTPNHRQPSLAGGSDSDVQRLLDGALGR